MGRNFLVQEIDGKLFFDDTLILKKPEYIKAIGHPIRLKILKLIAKEPMYPIQIAKALKMHEQKIYYHIQELQKAEIIEIVDKKEIRGTIAKRFSPKSLNFSFSMDFQGRDMKDLSSETKNKLLEGFLDPFIVNGRLNSKIVVGSPDPHGPFKARARDGHYAIDLALFLGGLSSLSKGFSTQLDVDTDTHKEKNLILVGGPVTNLTMAKINDYLPARFSEKKPWGIAGRKNYTDDNIGLIAKIQNPHFPTCFLLVVAGIRYGGTRAAVLGLTRFETLVLSRYTGQKNFYAILQGFDLDGDGYIDSVELLE